MSCFLPLRSNAKQEIRCTTNFYQKYAHSSNRCEPTVVFASLATDMAHIVRVSRQHYYDGECTSRSSTTFACTLSETEPVHMCLCVGVTVRHECCPPHQKAFSFSPNSLRVSMAISPELALTKPWLWGRVEVHL